MDSGTPSTSRYTCFRDFYPFYLQEHSKPWTRRFHFMGTSLSMIVLAMGGLEYLWAVPMVGYGFAWISHAFIEANKPATFRYPLYSFMGDLKLWSEMIRGQRWTDQERNDAPSLTGEQQHLVV